MTDGDIARQIASNPDAAPDMAPEIDVRAIRRATGMTQVEFAAAYEFSVRTVQEWERGRKKAQRPGADVVARHQGQSRGRAQGACRGVDRASSNRGTRAPFPIHERTCSCSVVSLDIWPRATSDWTMQLKEFVRE